MHCHARHDSPLVSRACSGEVARLKAARTRPASDRRRAQSPRSLHGLRKLGTKLRAVVTVDLPFGIRGLELRHEGVGGSCRIRMIFSSEKLLRFNVRLR